MLTRSKMGGAMNMIAVRSMLHTVLAEHGVNAASIDPWHFPTPEQYSKVLVSAGFRVESCGTIPFYEARPARQRQLISVPPPAPYRTRPASNIPTRLGP